MAHTEQYSNFACLFERFTQLKFSNPVLQSDSFTGTVILRATLTALTGKANGVLNRRQEAADTGGISPSLLK